MAEMLWQRIHEIFIYSFQLNFAETKIQNTSNFLTWKKEFLKISNNNNKNE